MKKVIIGLSGAAILALAVILFVNAKPGVQEVKKNATEISSNCAKCPSAATCTSMTAAKTTAAACDMTKCKEGKCDMTKCKEGKCDPATCKAKCEGMKSDMKAGEAKTCDPAACPMAKPVK